ncbi:hypothetical protein FGO68_gene3012 [Halteria grandinella]|uniref:Uncharacterized protein n=1 Tax=Halteria grandinella TaxID=5974 RepID=A0A8J8T9J9_HALGN|nr:hypothetical protein FGO68_gene3012 [Halteria grandinella]
MEKEQQNFIKPKLRQCKKMMRTRRNMVRKMGQLQTHALTQLLKFSRILIKDNNQINHQLVKDLTMMICLTAQKTQESNKNTGTNLQ